jgi:ATP-dependent helicase HrpB
VSFPLPIDDVLPELIAALSRHAGVVLCAPTGAGKTTCVPPALLDAGLAGSGRIVMLEPRRVAARAAARRMASERGGRLGEEIGYHVRFERCCGRHTRVLVVTAGILLRMLHDDPFLESTSVVIFDEFHERSLDNDFALGMVRLIQQTVRPELRLVVMSATLAAETVAGYLGHCPVLVSEGRLHPVDIVYDPKPSQQPWPIAVAAAVKCLLERTSGDLLVFLPGLQEIRQCMRQLQPLAETHDLLVLPLYGDLPARQQDAALLSQQRRKVVLATNVAETSVTVEGIGGVVDTGLARLQRFDPRFGLDRLQLAPISRASADQRAGRAGRTQPGVCVRLWSEASHRLRQADTEPEIFRVDLAGAVLHLLCLGEKDIARFPWLEPPPATAVERALTLLRRLGAVTDKGVTQLGRDLARLPVHPRLGRLLLEGQRHGQAPKAALAAALLSERDPFTRSAETPAAVRPPDPSPSDVLDRVDALEAFQRHHATPAALNPMAARWVLRARDQMLREVRSAAATGQHGDEVLLRALLDAFPDRVCRRREPRSRRGLMVGGRGVRLAATSAVSEPELFLAIDVDAGGSEALVRLASGIRREWLATELVRTATEVTFDWATKCVVAKKRVRYEDLLLEESSAALPDPEEVGRVLTAAAAEHLAKVLPSPDSGGANYLVRLRCLREWLPELSWPALDDAALADLLPWLCAGCRSFEDLRRADWLGALQGRLTPALRQTVEREAPERLEVPSGGRLALRYEAGRPPVLAARIQELFGLHETPRVAAGRVRVLLHLLAPNYRPQQVTDDLASFWKNTYQQVRKELRARYPRHAWPEDPWTAVAQRRPQRKKE